MVGLGPSLTLAKPKLSAVQAITVNATPIGAFDKADPARKSFGKLEWRGGLVLTSASSAFGGWSALAIDPDGRRLLGISDTGLWLTGELSYEGERPAGITNARLGRIEGPGGAILAPGYDDDSEGMAVVSGDLSQGEVLISFERNHRVGRFPVSRDGVGAQIGSIDLPPESARLEFNRSLESVCPIKGGALKGSVVTLAERYPAGHHLGWLKKPGAETWDTLRISAIDGFDLTDCAGLDDGSLLVLERRYRLLDVLQGPRMRLRRFTAAEVSSGDLMSGEVLMQATADHEIDNMEGLAVHRGAMGETVVTMISDDNFNRFLQRTVLLQFALPRPATAQSPLSRGFTPQSTGSPTASRNGIGR